MFTVASSDMNQLICLPVPMSPVTCHMLHVPVTCLLAAWHPLQYWHDGSAAVVRNTSVRAAVADPASLRPRGSQATAGRGHYKVERSLQQCAEAGGRTRYRLWLVVVYWHCTVHWTRHYPASALATTPPHSCHFRQNGQLI